MHKVREVIASVERFLDSKSVSFNKVEDGVYRITSLLEIDANIIEFELIGSVIVFSGSTDRVLALYVNTDNNDDVILKMLDELENDGYTVCISPVVSCDGGLLVSSVDMG